MTRHSQKQPDHPTILHALVQKAEELSRPKIVLAAKRGRNKNLKVGKPLDIETTGSVLAPAQAAAAKTSETTESRTHAEDIASIPTASRASAGIGPKAIEGAKVVEQNDGPKRELTDDQGGKRTVRIVAPTIIPVPAQVQAGTP